MKTHAAVAAVCARFAGLIIFAASLPEIGYTLGRAYKQIGTGATPLTLLSPGVDYYEQDPFTRLGWLFLCILGLHLLIGGRLVTRLLIRPLLANCQSCGYPLTSIKATRCPECGHDNPKRE